MGDRVSLILPASYLSNHRQHVECNGEFSQWNLMLLVHGVPQGNAWGLCCFLIYVNEMASQVYYGKLLQYGVS